MSKQKDDEMSRQDRAKAKRNRAEREQATIKDLADLGIAVAVAEPEAEEDDAQDAPVVADAIADKENPNHDPSNGQFASGGGSGGGDSLAHERGVRAAADLGAQVPARDLSRATNALRSETAGVKPVTPKHLPPAHVQNVIADYQRTGRIATHYPKLHEVSLNGARRMPEADAVARMNETIAANKKETPLSLFKQADGRMRVVGWASNNRRDKDNPPEIITEAAHKEFLAYLDAHPEHAPEFWHWHTPGTKYAKADWWDYADGFTVYSGLVDEGKEAQAEKAAADGIGMSHGFHVLGYDNAHNHITKYRTFEVSDLPITRAANPYTSFNVIRKEAFMAFSEAKKAYLLERLPAETVAELERKTSDLKMAADAAGIEAKDLQDEPVVTAADKAQDKPTDNPKAEESDGGNAKPKPDSEADDADELKRMRAAMEAMGKDVKAAVLTVAEGVKTLTERVTAVEAAATEAKQVAETAVQVNAKSLDDIVAEMISPSPLRKGYRPSAAENTKVQTAKKEGSEVAAPAAKAVEEPTLPETPHDWWTKEVMKPAGLA